MLQITNEYLQVTVSANGAELQSIIRKDNQLEYLWSGDPAFWGRKSPVLFPIVGGLKHNAYQYRGKTYQMGRHGFARDMVFNVIQQTAASIVFNITDTDETLLKYPFPFSLNIRYTVKDATLVVDYEVQNTGDAQMYFSIGAHPAFRIPLTEGLQYEDYALYFSEPETADLWVLSASGQLSDTPVPFLQNTSRLPLEKPMFYNDALVFKQLASTSVSIQSGGNPHGVAVDFAGFPYLGIWAARDADFVCIEPWCGLADHESASGKLEEKEGIIALGPEEVFHKQWSAIFF